MTTTPWNPALHDEAKRHAAALRREALNAAFHALGQVVRRLIAPIHLPEA